MSILSESCAITPHSAVLAACAEATRHLQQSSHDAADFQQPVLEVVHSAFAEHSQTLTASLTARLPDELLVDIFARLGFLGRIRVEQVCYRWRAVALRAKARLWSTIPGEVNVATLDAFLNRAGDVPVSVTRIYVSLYHVVQVFPVLRKHMHHIRRLDLYLWFDPVYNEGERLERMQMLLDGFLGLPAPCLEDICLEGDSVLEANPGRKEIPILESPRLRSIDLRYFNLCNLSSCAGSPTLRTLVIHLPASETSVADWGILASFPALEVLALSHHVLPEVWTDWRGGTLLFRLPPTLQRLQLDLCDEVFALLVDNLIPICRRIPLWKIRNPDAVRVLPPMDSLNIASAALHFSLRVDVMLLERTGHTRIVQGAQSVEDYLGLLATVEKLSYSACIDEPLLPDYFDVFVALPALRELTIDLSPHDKDCAKAYSKYTFRLRCGPCPQLHTVRVRSHVHGALANLNSLMFLLQRLLDPPRKLALLEFDNIELDSYWMEDADVLALLQNFAETISMRTVGDAWPECHILWNTAWDKLS